MCIHLGRDEGPDRDSPVGDIQPRVEEDRKAFYRRHHLGREKDPASKEMEK